MIRFLFIQEGSERRRDHLAVENFYYEAIYDILKNTHSHGTKVATLKRLKARILRLHSMEQRRVFLDNGEHDRLAGEEPTLYHILKRRRRQKSKMIHRVQDNHGNLHKTTTTDIIRTFTTFMRHKYADIAVDEGSVKHMAGTGNKTLPTELKDSLEAPITMEEQHLAVRKGKYTKRQAAIWYDRNSLRTHGGQPNTIWWQSSTQCFIHSFSILSDDRSKASSKTMPPHSAIQSLLLEMRISSPVHKVIQ